MKSFEDYHISLLGDLYERFYSQCAPQDWYYPEWHILRDIIGQIQSSLMIDEL